MHRPFCVLLMSAFTCLALFGQTTNPPGAPGQDAHWPSAAKNGFGTANSLSSKVWFTLTNGVMSEVFYPTLDTPNTQILQLVVCDQNRCFTEADDLTHELQLVDPQALVFTQTNRHPNGAFSISKTYITDPQRSTVLIDVKFTSNDPGSYQLYVYFDPSLNNSGMHDSGWNGNQSMLAADGNVASALLSSSGFEEMCNGYLGISDGLTQLRSNGRITNQYSRAENGNVVQVARLGNARSFTIALGFGANTVEAFTNASQSLNRSFSNVQGEYRAGWRAYLSKLRSVPLRYRAQYNVAAMVLKALEDKTHRGAVIASPTVPWGGGPNANEAMTSGYHAVWSRDLYHVATALLAMGDRAAAMRTLDFLFESQQKPDGSFPQNSHVDGKSTGGAVQMDQTAFPIILANQLNKTDQQSWLKHIKPAADFIVNRGPATEQERWEEESGYSPSTIASEIAALVCAARIATLNDDQLSARAYLMTADKWAREIDGWTATTTGPYDRRGYYIRITENSDPNDGGKIEINSGGGTYDERELVDAGFLELVRLGIKRPNDPLIVRSIAVVDKLIKRQTPSSTTWYRYNHDAYGETSDGGPYNGRTGVGRPWPLLAGERGEYELALGNRRAARSRLDALQRFANDGLMLPEQIWDLPNSPRADLRFGKGTGSATPLAWSMAQFIRLLINSETGRNVEKPAVVSSRYLKRSTNR